MRSPPSGPSRPRAHGGVTRRPGVRSTLRARRADASRLGTARPAARCPGPPTTGSRASCGRGVGITPTPRRAPAPSSPSQIPTRSVRIGRSLRSRWSAVNRRGTRRAGEGSFAGVARRRAARAAASPWRLGVRVPAQSAACYPVSEQNGRISRRSPVAARSGPTPARAPQARRQGVAARPGPPSRPIDEETRCPSTTTLGATNGWAASERWGSRKGSRSGLPTTPPTLPCRAS